MRHVTMTCPECGAEDRAVGDPNDATHGHSGKWYCFHCKQHGSYTIEFVTAEASPSTS